MPLTPGTHFGSHEITEPLGTGGMGEVYRAHDTELERDVAIKVLPASFTSDAARVARFEQEAKTLAALNHPNIAHVYGIERAQIAHADGAVTDASAEAPAGGSSTMTAIVMELVEGPTLAERIAQGPIPVDEALGLAMQIAEALEAAHEKGIIHRDLKPANVKLTSNGVVKLLDFGIAKVPEPSTTSGGRSPTLLTPALTEAGVLLGTAAYMSPEQTKGRAIDARVDIWSFGCLLYEMLTGQPAFGAEDVTTTLARVLEREPNMAALPSAVPGTVTQTVALCLEKDPKERIADMRDVRLALRGRFETTSATGSHASSGLARPLWRRVLPFAAAAAAVGIVAIPLGRQLASETASRAPATVNRFVQPLPISRTFAINDRSAVAVSPDGSSIAFTLDDAIYLRRLDEVEPKPIRGTEGGDMPFFSPDGQWLGFLLENRFFKVPTAGGIPVDLGQEGGTAGAAWLENGTIVFSRGGEFRRVSDEGGNSELIAKAADGRFIIEPHGVPGTQWVLYSQGDRSDVDNGDIVAWSPATGERKVVFTGGSDPRYVPSGHLLYVRGQALYAAPFDLKTMTVTGAGLPVIDGLSRSPIVTENGNYDVSNDGMLAYLEQGAAEKREQLVWVDRTGREERIPVTAGIYRYPRISPDGRRAVLMAEDDRGSADLLALDLARNVFVPVANTDASESSPAWMHDSRRVAYHIPPIGEFLQAADGTSARDTISKTEMGWPQASTTDGKELVLMSVFGTHRNFGHGGIGAISLDPLGAQNIRWIVEAPPGQYRRNPVLSPDDRWLAYESNETGTAEVFVRAYPEVARGLQRVSVAGGLQPVWSRDGRELFYLEPGSPPRLMSVSVESGDTLTLGQPQPIMDWKYSPDQPWKERGYDVDPSGRRFLALKPVPVALQDIKLSRLHIVQNWFAELERLVPTKSQ